MNDVYISTGGFLVCALVIFFAGKKLAHYGDLLAEISGLGKAWIGLILMAGVTSLPELMVGISSSAIVKSADLAVGDILGSCSFNLGILALMDAFTPKNKPLLANASPSHLLAAALGLVLVSLVGAGIYLDIDIPFTHGIGFTSTLFAVIYFLSVRLIYQYNQNHPKKEEEIPHQNNLTLKQVVIRYSFFALIIIIAALFLPHFAEQIAEFSGLGKSFVGTLFLAASTSLPEVAVSIAAIRIGAVDLAVGNLFGSNIFNVFILFIDDVFYTSGHILKHASKSNMISVFAFIIMSAIVIIGLTYQAKGKRYFLAWDALLIFLVFVTSLFLLYKAA